MRLRDSKTRAMTAVSAAAVTVVLALGLTGAIAAVAGDGLPAIDKCGIEVPRCGTPLVYRPVTKHLGLQASAKHADAPLVIQEEDPGQPLQEWMYLPVGRMDKLSRTVSQRMRVTAFDIRHYRSAWLVRLELTPGGTPSGWCAANVHDALMLERCNGGINQTFIQSRTANGNRAIVGYYGLSMIQRAQMPGHHAAATGSYRRGTQVVFSKARRIDLQYWYQLKRHRKKTPTPTPTRPHPSTTPPTTPPVPSVGRP